MRIIHVVEPFASGISTFILQLTNYISEHEHIIIHGVRDNENMVASIQELFPPNVSFVRWTNVQRNITFAGDRRAYKELKQLFQQLNPDILHLHSSKAGVLGRLAARSLRLNKVVYTPNAVSFLRTDVSWIHKLIYKTIEKIMSWFPGKIISSSTGEKDALEAIHIVSTLIYNGVDFSEYAYEIKPEFKVVTCGRVTIQKNPGLFNEIAKAFVNYPDIKFVWIGAGDLEHELTSPNIHITRWLTTTEVRNELCNATIYLSTSNWEGLSLASVEAMAVGLPLFLRDACGNPDLIGQERNGFLFHTCEEAIAHIQSVIAKPELLEKFAKASRVHYERNFTGIRCAQDYSDLYQNLIRLSDGSVK